MLVSDVDGVLTDGKFSYSAQGKAFKVFGSHDADALSNQSFFEEIVFVTADKRGYEISSKRIEDMGHPLVLMPADARATYISERQRDNKIFFIGDSFSDLPAMRQADCSAAPKNAFPTARLGSKIRLARKGGEGALAELILLLSH